MLNADCAAEMRKDPPTVRKTVRFSERHYIRCKADLQLMIAVTCDMSSGEACTCPLDSAT